MSIDKNLYAGINATYIRSLLLSAGFSNTDLPPKPLVLVQKLEDYLQSYDWTVDWYDSIDPTKLNDKLLSLYDELSDVRNMKLDDVSPVDDMMTTLSLQLGITEAVESVRDDVKLLPPVEVIPEPVEVIELPQEVVSEPQEDCLSTTTLNEDTVMNTSTFIPSWEVSGYVSLLDLDFGTYVVVEPEPIVELTGQASDFACHISDGWTGQCTELTCDVLSGQCSDVLEGWIGKASEVTCHISDGWFGQCCDFADAPKPIESKSEQLAEVEARVARACAKMARRSAYASPVRYGTPVNTTPTTTPTTTNSEVVQVSDEQFAELEKMFDKAMAKPKHPFTGVNRKSFQGNQINPDCSRTKASIGQYGQVSEFKSTLFNVDEYDITRNVVVDVATTTPKSTPATPKATVAPKAPATPKPSTAKFANNFNSLVIAKYRELNNGIIKDSLVLNKLTSALRANDIETYNKYVTTFNSPTAVALHRQAYDAVVSAS